MSLSISRAATSAGRQAAKLTSRQSSRSSRRFESTTAKAAEAAKNTASEYKTKASEGLSRVTASAGPAISGAAKGLGNALGKVGGRTGRLIAFVERQIPQTIYYARVGLELSKLVFAGQKMSPPPLATFQSYFQTVIKSVRNPSTLFARASKSGNATPADILQSFRNATTAQWAAGGVVAAEVLGFFTVGEMIGRFKLIGYKGDTGAHH